MAAGARGTRRVPTVEDAAAEPADVRRRRGSPGLAVLAAASLALVLGWAAPDGWPSGPGRVEVATAGGVERVAVEVGSSAPVSAAAPALVVELPDGVPTTGPFTVLVRDPTGGAALGDVSVTLVTADGVRRAIPVLGEDDGVLRAARRGPDHAPVVLGLLGAVVVAWVTEAVPLHVTSLAIPVVLTVAGASSATDALAPFFHPVIVLFFAGFLLARAMQSVGLDRVVASALVARAGRSPRQLFLTLVAVAAGASMWMSNTATVALLLPIALTVTEPLGDAGYRKTVVLGIAYAGTIGGVGSAIGTPANPLAIEFLGEVSGREVSFVEWFAFGLPLVALFLPLMAGWLWWRNRARPDPARFEAARAEATRVRVEAGPLDRDQLWVLAVFAAVFGLWLAESWHHVPTGIVALGGAVVLMATGHLTGDDLGRISWSSLLTFGGGLTLGFALTASGTSDWIVGRLDVVGSLPGVLGVVAVGAVTLVLTTVASNTASAAVLVPLAIPLAGVVGVEPSVLVVVVALASSVDFALVIGTPPTMLAYSTRLFSAGEILRTGLVLDVVGLALVTLALPPLWRLLGVA